MSDDKFVIERFVGYWLSNDGTRIPQIIEWRPSETGLTPPTLDLSKTNVIPISPERDAIGGVCETCKGSGKLVRDSPVSSHPADSEV